MSPTARFMNKLIISIACIWISWSVSAESRRDFLRGVATQCVDTKADNYCAICNLPRSDSVCSGHDSCTKSLGVWRQTDEFVAFRDIKMCPCPSDFVHGLVLPRKPITGVEDPNRPAEIWQMAWDVGITKINSNKLALVVNPRGHRSQDQLHVHMVQLKSDIRLKLLGTTIKNLNDVWSTAAHLANIKGLTDYGVLVTQNPEGGYLVVIDEDSPEYKFTIATCE
jgi:CDP-diacylglycerol pyrophosphatase